MKDKAQILIVDDNINLTKTMGFILKRKGHTVTTAKDGIEAIQQIKKDHFDIIFMDIKMPIMDGVETFKRIKKIKPEAIVMMMTAYAVEDLIQEAMDEGAYGIIYKPLDIENMINHVRRVRDSGQGGLILVVDDDPGTYTTFKNILSKNGSQVAICTNGEEAIAAVQEKSFDLIFIDMKLPTINGLETYLAIKEIKPDVIAVMVTGYREEMNELVQSAIDENAYTCLYKPLELSNVLQLIDNVLRRKKSAG